MIGLMRIHEYAKEYLYKLLNWQITAANEDDKDCPHYVYCFANNKSIPDSKIYILECFKENMGNDILFSGYTDWDGNVFLEEMSYINYTCSATSGCPYIICGEYNATLQRFMKVAVIDMLKFVEHMQNDKIKIDTTFTKSESYILDGVLYGVAKKEENDTVNVSIDIGLLTEFDNDIIFYQYGFMSVDQKSKREFATPAQVKYLNNLFWRHGLKPSKLFDSMTKREAHTLISFFTESSLNFSEIRNIANNKALLHTLTRYVS